ncbi:MAG TPA: glycoside hydrolase family 32 protein [Cyclobacteriaceae bacterium]
MNVKINLYSFLLFFIITLLSCGKKSASIATPDSLYYSEAHRPQLHFSPKEKWMNDPNGMVYYQGEYHLFYQYYPEAMVWGPMHWGHAVSTDMIHWEHLPIALYPDSLGLIFSGSVVADVNNTSQLGTTENPPLVAMFTYHSMEKEKAGKIDYQNQGIAYSIDKGRTWTKYEHNPVLKNPGIKDFRDPKMFWHAETKKWIVILAVFDHVELYSSDDLKTWHKLSEFGKTFGTHGGVWECPDLFQLKVENEDVKKWVMLVSVNPGGPNGGSGTQYFTGDFDGVKFTAAENEKTIKWIDYGPDDYAGVTWSNTPGERKLFLGWMSNWAYAQQVPTSPWRSAMTVPRELKLEKIKNDFYLKSSVVDELNKQVIREKNFDAVEIADSILISKDSSFDASMAIIEGSIEANDLEFSFTNALKQRVTVGFDADKKQFVINRSKAGSNEFSKDFRGESYSSRISVSDTLKFTIVTDVSSVEVFFDDGLSTMTSIHFPDERLANFSIHSKKIPVKLYNLTVKQLKSIWR